MEIQRQSDFYGLDRSEVRQSHLTADQISKLIKGPEVPTGSLDTHTAAVSDDDEDYDEDDYCRECGDELDITADGHDVCWDCGEKESESCSGIERNAADFGKGPRDHGGAGPDGGPANPPEFYDEEEEEDENDPERFIPESYVREGRRLHAAEMPEVGIDGAGGSTDTPSFSDRLNGPPMGEPLSASTAADYGYEPGTTLSGAPMMAAPGYAGKSLLYAIDPGISMTGDGNDVTPLNRGPIAPGYTARIAHAELTAAIDRFASPACTCGHHIGAHDRNVDLSCDNCPCAGLTVRSHSHGRN